MNNVLDNIDEPFTTIEVDEAVAFHCVVTTPTGDEFVELAECSHPTRTMSLKEIERLVAESSPHRHGTVPSMPAALSRSKAL